MNHDSAPPLKLLVTEGLGYCCVWGFFCCFSKTDVIADRLGCERRTVQLWRKRFRDGELRCEDNDRCMYAAIIRAGKICDRRRFSRDT